MTMQEYQNAPVAKRATLNKTTLAHHNSGRTSSANNCYYKGTSTVWQVIHDNVVIAGFRVKRQAVFLFDYINYMYEEEHGEPWDGNGDIVMMAAPLYYLAHDTEMKEC